MPECGLTCWRRELTFCCLPTVRGQDYVWNSLRDMRDCIRAIGDVSRARSHPEGEFDLWKGAFLKNRTDHHSACSLVAACWTGLMPTLKRRIWSTIISEHPVKRAHYLEADLTDTLDSDTFAMSVRRNVTPSVLLV